MRVGPKTRRAKTPTPTRPHLDGPGIALYGEDNNGDPAFVLGGPLYGAGLVGTLWHIDLVLDPVPANDQLTFSGALNGAPMNDHGTTSRIVDTGIPSTLTLTVKGLSPNAEDGAGTASFDDILVTKLD